ncbi:MAG: hypothetical protein QOE25_879 [Actinomycetota bacterium]|nr:hypothetical protein [Actinomycetota bacterium]
MIIERGDEQLRDASRVDRRGLCQSPDARVGQRDHNSAAVCVCIGSPDETFVDQPPYSPSHTRSGDERPGGKLGHPELTTSPRQLRKNVEVGKGQTGLSLEIGLQPPHEGGVRLQQGGPGLQSASFWQLGRHEPVEEPCDVGFPVYLHMQ